MPRSISHSPSASPLTNKPRASSAGSTSSSLSATVWQAASPAKHAYASSSRAAAWACRGSSTGCSTGPVPCCRRRARSSGCSSRLRARQSPSSARLSRCPSGNGRLRGGLPGIAGTGDEIATVAVPAVVVAGGDVFLVGQVVGIELNPEVVPVVTDHAIENGVGRHFQGFGVIPVAGAGMPSPCAEGHTIEHTATNPVTGPDRRHLVSDVGRGLAFFRRAGGFGGFRVELGIAGHQAQALGDVGLGLQFDAAATHFTQLGLNPSGQGFAHVFLGQLEQCNVERAIEPWRLILQAQLFLLALLRLKWLAGAGIQVGNRQEEFGIAGIGRQAVVEDVGNTGAPGEILVADIEADTGAVIVEIGARLVVAPTQQENPAVIELELLLEVEADLIGAGLFALQCAGIDRLAVGRGNGADEGQGHSGGILGVVDIQQRHAGEAGVAGRAAVVDLQLLVVNAEQQAVLPAIADPVAEQAVVHRNVVRLAVAVSQTTGDQALARVEAGEGVVDVAEAVKLTQFQIHMAVAQVLLEIPGIAKSMVEFIAQGVLGAVELLVTGVADGSIGVDLAVRVGGDGAAGREKLQLRVRVVLLETGQQGQGGVGIEVHGQRRGQQQALGVHVVDLGAGVATQGHHAVQQVALLIQLAAHIQAQLLAIIAAVLNAHFILVLGARALALQIDQAARRGLTVEHRGRALEHLDTFEHKGVDLPAVEGAGVDARAVHKQAVVGLLEAANDKPVLLVVLAIEARLNARHITQGIADGLYVAVVHLLLGDHRNRAWGFVERGVDLGRAAAVLRHVALVFADRAVQLAGDAHALQFDGLIRRLQRAGQ